MNNTRIISLKDGVSIEISSSDKFLELVRNECGVSIDETVSDDVLKEFLLRRLSDAVVTAEREIDDDKQRTNNT